MRIVLAAWVVVVVGCSSSESTPGAGVKPRPKCPDVATCTAACAPCRTGACTERDGRACHVLGGLHLRGAPPQFDIVAAAAAYEAGCKAFAPACSALALQVQDGRGVPADAEKAAALYTRACEERSGVGCFNVGMMHLGGVGAAQDDAKARDFFQRAEKLYLGECDADPSWCSNLGYLYESGWLGEKDPTRAAAVYQRACDRGDLDACGSLGLLEMKGEGVPKQEAAALARLEKVCKAGGVLACPAVVSFRDPQLNDPTASVPLLAQACDGGIKHACGMLGSLYMPGGPVPPDPAKADALLGRACDLGHLMSCLVLGDEAKATEPARAGPYFERACHIGSPDACMAYAALIAIDKIGGDAMRWIREACRQGQRDACEMLAKRQQR